MDTLNIETIRLLLIFFVPGFISIKVYDLLVPSERRDIDKSLLEALTYSCINFALLYWLIIAIHTDGFQTNYPYVYYGLSLLILFIMPIIWPITLLKILEQPFFKNRVINPVLKPWDRLFAQRKAYWVIVHLKNGKMIGGKYGIRSFTSTYPAPEQIYLEEVWDIDPSSKRFIRIMDRTQGIIISEDEFQSLEFFR